jgi:Tol biopolymer transport system component
MRRLLRLCLEKDPQTRRQSAGDVRVDLDHAETEQPATVPLENSVRYSRRARMMWLAGLVLLLGPLAIPAVLHLRKPPAPELRLQIVTPPTLDPLDFALSPDGQQIVFVASGGGSDSGQRLYLRALNDVNPQPLDGTDGARFPFWSPDGRSLGFFASGSLFRIDVSGGPAQRLAPAANPLGGAWGADGTILFAPNFVSPLFQVPATGGKSVPATQFDSSDQNNHRLPSFLPDGRGFLFYVPGESDASGIFLGSLDGTPAKRLTAANSAGEYLAPDHIVYLQDGALVARKFVTAKGEWAGDPITLAKPKGENDAISGFSVSATGTVAYRTGSSAPALLTWFDHIGKVMERSLLINAPELSPNGNLVAFDRTIKGNRDVWVLDLVRGGLSPLTFHPKVDGFPVWSPEGTRIAFETNREGNFDIWVKQASGAVDTEQRLHGTPDNEWPLDWSSDGRFLLFCKTDEYYVSSDLYALPMTGDNPKPVAVANTPFEERRAKFSPDGKWVAYDTDQSGRSEVVVQAFPASTGTVLVSTAGGSTPRWSADGKEIYFIGSDERMMAVSVAVENSTIKLGKPAALFSTQISNLIFKHQYVVTRDGRFGVLNRQAQESSPITVILNWKP